MSYLKKYIPLIEQIQSEDLKEKVARVYLRILKEGTWKGADELTVMPGMKASQAEHQNAVAEMALELSRILSKVHRVDINQDYVLAGAILHDVSKFVEFEKGNGEESLTKLGRLVQHGFHTAQVALEMGIPLEVAHIIIVHTPQSNLMPKTLEALVVFFADLLDFNSLRIIEGLEPKVKKNSP